jgi:hypothetical protein
LKVRELLQEGQPAGDARFRARDLAQLRRDYATWKQLVNIPTEVLRKAARSQDSEEIGLSPNEVKANKRRKARLVARAILRQRSIPFAEWTTEDLNWLYRQLAVITRLKARRGPFLVDGKPTKKLLALWAWGHAPHGLMPTGRR